MSRNNIRIKNTDLDNLVSNLRGEIGENISSWVLMRKLKTQARRIQTNDISHDMKNGDLTILYCLIDKLENEIIASLSELSGRKVGQLTFYFVQEKLHLLKDEIDKYEQFIHSNRFCEKRNYEISHKQLPEKWSEHKYIPISYRLIVKGIVLALRLMKKIDKIVLGPSAPFLWREMRKRRYTPVGPAKAAYMILPHLCLNEIDRIKIVFLEAKEDKNTWVDMKTTSDGSDIIIKACKKWGVIQWHDSIMALKQYPLIEITSIEMKRSKPIHNEGEELTKAQ
jgi:hypothetical protein